MWSWWCPGTAPATGSRPSSCRRGWPKAKCEAARDRERRSTSAGRSRPARSLRAECHRPDQRLQRSAPGVAALVLRTARHVLPGAGRRGRRHDGPRLPRRDQPRRRGGGPRADGHGHHLVHGQDLRRAPEPGGQHRLRATPRLPLVAGTGLHHRAARRRLPRGAGPARDHQRLGHVRVELSRARLFQPVRVLDGTHPDHRPGQRDPRHRVRCPERRHHRRLRGRGLYRPGLLRAAPSPAPR